MPETLTEKDWDTILWRINDGNCTPFLGAGACYGILPLGKDIAKKWAKEEKYPLTDCEDLARVAQFLAVDRKDPMFPKEKIKRMFKDVPPPDFNEPDEPHAVLADLPLPVYITTNYDSFMVQALKNRNKDPELKLCQWNKYIKDQTYIIKSRGSLDPSPANPVVFHLHGYLGLPESIVLTEDDYLDFLVNISRNQKMLAPRIQRAMTGASLLFIGYRLADWSFRVLFRGLISTLPKSLRRMNVAVQLPPDEPEQDPEEVQNYLSKYLENTDVLVYWGTARKFAAELKDRWEKFKKKLKQKKEGSKHDG